MRRGAIERQLLKAGIYPAGVDEVGRGCVAGPVYAGAVRLDYAKLARLPAQVRALVRDSKTLSKDQRLKIIPTLLNIATHHGVASASVSEIEEVGILNAAFLAMRRALIQAKIDTPMLLIDGKVRLREYHGPQMTVVGGDNACYAIAAASILAKEARDEFMRSQDSLYPEFGFAQHVGYGTKRHLEMLAEHGTCPLHRKNFRPVASVISSRGLG